jgi:hypothetical protein
MSSRLRFGTARFPALSGKARNGNFPSSHLLERAVDQIPRHQCLVYGGEPSRQLVSLTLLIR